MMSADSGGASAGGDGRALRYAERRRQLLDGATEVLLTSGLRDFSLRPVAAALGVTHASLLRHFTSKDELLLAVLENIRRDVSDQLAVTAATLEESPAIEVMRSVWQHLSEPRQQRQFLLLFELVDRRQVESRVPKIAAALVDDWVRLVGDYLRAAGWSQEDAQMRATQIRGLQLDLLVTGDRRRVDQAFEVSLAYLTLDKT
jgi:AcrR family transcriptional regulator